MKHTTLLFLTIILIAIGGIFILQTSVLPKISNKTISPTVVVSTPSAVSDTPQTYTLADVSDHSNSSSCWSIINSKVYDLTSFISLHPGGVEEIMRVCGVDGTNSFNEEHANQSEPMNDLASLYIGELAK